MHSIASSPSETKLLRCNTVSVGFQQRQHKRHTLLLALGALVLMASITSLSFGPAGWDLKLAVAWLAPDAWPQFSPLQLNIVTDIRLPRLCLALLIGAVLAQTGAATQALCRNPLADPSVIGISSGAAVVAVALIAFAPNFNFNAEALLPYGAFCGALLVTMLVYRFAQSGAGIQVTALILIGVAINALSFALIGLFSFYADDSSLRLINYWTMGSLAGATWSTLFSALPLFLICIVGLWLKRKEMSLLLLGETEAEYAGINISRLKNQIVLFVAIGVGAAVALTGLIGFIGLVVPHLARILVGTNMRAMMPVSLLLGALVILASDWVARVIVLPAELPIGIVTALLGAPLFIWLLHRQLRSAMR
ncbi:FecCD family ABC transporter permease [Planctobacterium marinum]|uniref:Hemin ABC transporter permease n=1 Tax=Planctobacterium marinum TaxID=1631968 RepID=A0AA48KRC3_9ALTE|nr:hemin ABC transporter permease [Planctobacterium marinum]